MKTLILSILAVAFATPTFILAKPPPILAEKSTDLCYISYKTEDTQQTVGCFPVDEKTVVAPAFGVFAAIQDNAEVFVNFPLKPKENSVVLAAGIKLAPCGNVAFIQLSKPVKFDEPSGATNFTAEIIDESVLANNTADELSYVFFDNAGQSTAAVDSKSSLITTEAEKGFPIEEYGGPVYAYNKDVLTRGVYRRRRCITIGYIVIRIRVWRWWIRKRIPIRICWNSK